MLDACFHVMAALFVTGEDDKEKINTYLPFAMEEIALYKPLSNKVLVYAQPIETNDDKTKKANLKIFDNRSEHFMT